MSRRTTTRYRARTRHSSLGIAYLELTASLFVLSIGILGAFQLFHFSIDRMQNVTENNIAMRAIQNEIEWLRARPFAEVALGEGPFASSTPESTQLVNAQARVNVDLFRPQLPEVKRVEVTLSWSGDQGRTITKSAVTLLADKRTMP